MNAPADPALRTEAYLPEPSAPAGEAERLVEDSDRVELRGGGWVGPIGHCNDFRFLPEMAAGSIRFELFRSRAFYFVHAATVLVVQGSLTLAASAKASVPYSPCIASNPANMPGTDTESGPVRGMPPA